MSYPKWVSRGHGLGDILCLNEDEEKAVADEIAAREKPAVEEDTDEDTVDTLRAKLDELGIAYHHKAGVEKLKALLPD